MPAKPKVTPSKDLKLSKLERAALEGIFARQQIAQQEIARAEGDAEETLASIEERLGLAENALRSNGAAPTHQIDGSSWQVVPLPKAPAAPGEIAEALSKEPQTEEVET